jgi:ornithine carbamoyltransferase
VRVAHFLTLKDLEASQISDLINRALQLKALRKKGQRPPLFENKTLAMIFEKSSTRTRVSFEAAMAEHSGSAIFLSAQDSQISRGEPPEDTARVLSEMSDAVMIRTYDHGYLEKFAKFSKVPVINGLTNSFHPCQLLADLTTYFEFRGAIIDRKVAWVGDGNNMCRSYINAAELMSFNLSIACPEGYEPIGFDSDKVDLFRDPIEAVSDADLVVTDVWASMGQENEVSDRQQVFQRYQVNRALMTLAKKDALFMHCLPAHRGEEVEPEVIDGPNSVVWEEAGNRLHVQKALLELLFSNAPTH